MEEEKTLFVVQEWSTALTNVDSVGRFITYFYDSGNRVLEAEKRCGPLIGHDNTSLEKLAYSRFFMVAKRPEFWKLFQS